MHPLLFCPQCHAYLGARDACPACDWARAAHERIPPPGLAQWRFTASGPIRGRPALDETTVYVGSRDGNVYAVERATGAERWRFQTDGRVDSSPTLHGGALYVGSDDGHVYALDAATGQPRWQAPAGDGVRGQPAVGGGIVCVLARDAHVYAFDAGRGTPRWRFETGRAAGSSPIIAGDMVYVGSYDQHLYALDARLGRQLWTFAAGGKIASTPALGAGLIYFGTLDDGCVYAVRAQSGALAWKQSLGGYVHSSPVLAGDAVYVGCNDGRLYALEAQTGRVRWQCPLGGAVASSPAVWEGLAFVGCNAGYVHAVSAAEGQEAWRFRVGADVIASPAIDEDGAVYVGADDGTLYALPWHLGQWAWAAAWCEGRGWTAEAAAFHALAGDETRNLQDRRGHYDAAIAVWRDSLALERAARLREAVLDPPAQVAAEYEHAARVVAPTDGVRAADLYFRAADCYDEAGQEAPAHECRAQATRLARAPRLQVRPVNLPPFEAGEPGEIVLDVRNYGATTAQDVRVRLAGQLAKRVTFALPDIAPGQTVELAAEDITPLDQELRVDLYYRGGRGAALQASQRFALNVKPLDADILVGENAGNVILRLAEGAPVPKVRVKGSAGLVKVQVG